MVLRQRPGCIFLALSTAETREISAKSQVTGNELDVYRATERSQEHRGEKEHSSTYGNQTLTKYTQIH